MQLSELLQKSFWNRFGPAILVSIFLLGNASAQYPDKALTLVMPFPPAGLPKFELVVWHELSLPKSTPKPIVERLANSLRAALKDPILVQRYTEMGAIIAPPNTVNPDYLKSFLRADVDKWKVAMKNANIQPE